MVRFISFVGYNIVEMSKYFILILLSFLQEIHNLLAPLSRPMYQMVYAPLLWLSQEYL